MKENKYSFEGAVSCDNKEFLLSESGLLNAKELSKILQARCKMCDAEHNLHLDLGDIEGIIPRDEAALGIKDGSVKDVAIITRVNKFVCFKVLDIKTDDLGKKQAILSRVKAQEEALKYYLNNLKRGDIINAKVTHLEQFGAFVDIGCGVISMISIDNISVSRINHPRDRFCVGMEIKAVVKDIDIDNKRIILSHKELLGSWQENADKYQIGQTVSGIIRSIEDYGVFVEIAPNLAGLAEPDSGVKVGQNASVYIKNIIPDKMKIKLSIIDISDEQIEIKRPEYFILDDHIDNWSYSPAGCKKVIKTDFYQIQNI